MSDHPLLRLRNPALLLALASVFPAFSYAAGAARIDFTAGPVTAVSASGAQRSLGKGAEIGNGETIRTGDDARAQLRFSDGALVSLQPKTEFRIDNYQYAGQPDGKEQGFFSLLRGGLRTITGWVGRSNREAYKVKTQVATIGIRGTGYKTALDETGNELLIGTSEGEVEVCNDAGCIILASGENGVVQGNNPPRRTGNQPVLSPTTLGQMPQLDDFVSGSNRNPDGSYGALGDNGSALTGLNTYSTVYSVTEMSGSIGPAPLTEAHTGPGEINPFGVLIDFKTSQGPTQPNLPSNIAASLGNDGIVAWGFWIAGAANFGGSLSGGEGSNGILHYVTGLPASNPALGGITGTYSLHEGAIGNPNVTSTGSDIGTVTSASLTANFSTNTVTSLNVAMTMDSAKQYVINESPASLPISVNGFSSSTALVSSPNGACGSGCSLQAFSGAFFGAGAPRAGVGFRFTADTETVSGAAPLKRN